MPASRYLLLIAVLCIPVVSMQARAGNKTGEPYWPQWRGLNRDGISPDIGLLTKWPKGGPRLVWKTTGAGEGYSAVTTTDGRLYTMGNIDNAEFILAFDVESGKKLWASRSGDAYSNNRGNGPRGSVTIDGDRLYSLGANGDLCCLDAADGKQIWHVNVLDRFKVKNIHWGMSESPLIENEMVIVNAGARKASVVALNKMTGKTLWKSKRVSDQAGYSSALAVTVGDVRQIIHFTSKSAIGVRAADGDLLWRYTKASNGTANITTPIFHDNHVFVTSAYGTGAALLALSPDGTGTKAKEVYFTKDMMNHHGAVVLVDGYLYGFSKTILTCLEFKSGKRMWRNRSVGKGSVTYADGHLYCLSEKGVMGLVEATPEAYREKSRFEIEKRQWPTWAHPVVTGGKLFLRNIEEISCYDIRGPVN